MECRTSRTAAIPNSSFVIPNCTCPSVPDLLTALRSGASVFAAELRPPRAELAAREGMDAWIDTYHAVRRLTQAGHVRLPDRQRRRRGGGRQPPAPRHQSRSRRAARAGRAVPDGRSTRSTTACRTPSARARTAFLRWSSSAATRRSASRAASSTPGSCASMIRERDSTLALGGWANPHADAGAPGRFPDAPTI